MLLTSKYVRRLHRAIRRSEQIVRGYREKRLKVIRQYIGRHYGNAEDSVKATPLSGIYLSTLVYVAQLSARRPAVKVRTEYAHLRPFAFAFEMELNRMIRKELDVRRRTRQVVVDALFGVGLTKTGLAGELEARIGGERVLVGEPFFDRFDMDDYVFDPAARDREEMLWEGNRYRLPLHIAQEEFENADKLKASYKPTDDRSGELAEMEADPGAEHIQEITDFVEVYDVYIPSERLLVTIPKEGQGTEPLQEVEWRGPEHGPYDMLGFHYVPNKVMPLPPASKWYDLDVLANALLRKIRRQLERAKTIVAAEIGSEEDAQKLRDASDGEIVYVRRPDTMQEVKFGGPDQELMSALQFVVGLFSRQSGNTDLMGGLNAEARSATEASFLQANSKTSVNDMRVQVEDMVRRAVETLGYWRHTDPLKEFFTTYTIPGTDLQVPYRIEPQARSAVPFSQLDFEVVPYSMQPQDPEQQAQRLYQWFTQAVLPTMQFAMMQGDRVNIPGIVRKLAYEWDIDGADELYQPAPPNAISEMVGQGMTSMAQDRMPVSNRASAEQQSLDMLAQQLGQKMPGQNPGQAPPHMSQEALGAAARGM